MKDKLRELAERWKVFHSISNGYTEAVNDCGTELLAILDAEGSAPYFSTCEGIGYCYRMLLAAAPSAPEGDEGAA